jgi:hypothetical protein
MPTVKTTVKEKLYCLVTLDRLTIRVAFVFIDVNINLCLRA